MARSTGLLALFGAFAPAALAATTTTSASNVFNIFVIDPTGPVAATPVVQASVISVDPALSQTAYWISCEMRGSEFYGLPPPPPCNYIGGASVTINPTGMTLRVRRGSQVVSVRPATDGLGESITRETTITVTATATCAIDGSTSASCTGHMTSQSEATTHRGEQPDRTSTATRTTTTINEDSTTSTWGTTSIETISTEFGDVAAHSIPVTVTAGLEKIESAATSATIATTSSSTGAAARPTAGGGMSGGRGRWSGLRRWWGVWLGWFDLVGGQRVWLWLRCLLWCRRGE
ncbi:hypothetical protein B0I37DRAFT_76636 [Chaetomium sp. MPI-CAGE-AT-0009]|nr:hypothetical protein B0I37DRAFT_76636 [Chaetomium sp. MPI-CAGE-AT-0009]